MENPFYQDAPSHEIDFFGSQGQKSSFATAGKQMEDSIYIAPNIPAPDYENSKSNYSCSLSSRTIVDSHFGHEYNSLCFNSDYETPRKGTAVYAEIPEPDYYDDTASAPIPSKSPFGNFSYSTINTPAPLISYYKRCSSNDILPDSPENHGIGTLLIRSLVTICIMVWKVSAVCLLTVSIIRVCDNGIQYLWTTTQGHVIISLTIFLVLSFLLYMLRSCCKRNRTVNRTPVFL
ncbi:uncharacterized protein LOC118192394 [Stegodyphus dumicola]|uniref:uncharacterized protein LOC118192394 n=1 Tax=Stegodyphus dumicola TaxID=202533 RepID=UPI0015AB1DAC|nr:uncharacterized protein LOC118192394 [Stegodyphus dumicola]